MHAGMAQPHVVEGPAVEGSRNMLAFSFAVLPEIPASCFEANSPDIWDSKLAHLWGAPLRVMLVTLPPLDLSAYAGFVEPLRSFMLEVDQKRDAPLPFTMAKPPFMDLDPESESFGECPELPPSILGVLGADGKNIGYQQLYALIQQTTAVHYASQKLKHSETGATGTRKLARQKLLEVVPDPKNFVGCFEGVKEDVIRAGLAEWSDVECPTDWVIAAASKVRRDFAGFPAMETKAFMLSRTKRLAHVAEVIMRTGRGRWSRMSKRFGSWASETEHTHWTCVGSW